MVDKNIYTVEEFLKKENTIDTGRKKSLPKKNESGRKCNKISKSGIIKAAVAIFLSVVTLGSSCAKKNNNNDKDSNKEDIVYSQDSNQEVDKNNVTIDGLGLELEIPSKENLNLEYGNASGNIDKNEIVENNGSIWVNQAASLNSSEVGKEILDTKDGSLETGSNGNVYDKVVGYEIQDSTGNIISSGDLNDNGIPEGYYKDEKTGDLIHEGQYVDPDGNIWTSKERYEQYIESLKTDNTTIETGIIPSENDNLSNEISSDNNNSSNIEENTNGMYTDPDFGLTFQSKEDYDQWVLQGYEGYGIIGGIMVPETQEMKEAQKVLTK